MEIFPIDNKKKKGMSGNDKRIHSCVHRQGGPADWRSALFYDWITILSLADYPYESRGSSDLRRIGTTFRSRDFRACFALRTLVQNAITVTKIKIEPLQNMHYGRIFTRRPNFFLSHVQSKFSEGNDILSVHSHHSQSLQVSKALVHPVISPSLLSVSQSTPDTLLISPLDLTMFTTEKSSKRERMDNWPIESQRINHSMKTRRRHHNKLRPNAEIGKERCSELIACANMGIGMCRNCVETSLWTTRFGTGVKEAEQVARARIISPSRRISESRGTIIPSMPWGCESRNHQANKQKEAHRLIFILKSPLLSISWTIDWASTEEETGIELTLWQDYQWDLRLFSSILSIAKDYQELSWIPQWHRPLSFLRRPLDHPGSSEWQYC